MGRVQCININNEQTLYLYDDLGRKITEESSTGFKGYYYEGISQNVSSYFIGRNHQIVYENIFFIPMMMKCVWFRLRKVEI